MKIALIGSCPSSAPLAPYHDKDWTIWGCSPGAVQHVRRIDMWFEMHPWVIPDYIAPDYAAFLASGSFPVQMLAKLPQVPTSEAYPIKEMLEQFGPNWWTSTISYMMALAISKQPEEIGFWGIDLAANEEYDYQKPALLRFIEIAIECKIKIVVPPQSDLLRPPPMYGYFENTPMGIKVRTKRNEVQERLDRARAVVDQAERQIAVAEGGMNMLRYFERTWHR